MKLYTIPIPPLQPTEIGTMHQILRDSTTKKSKMAFKRELGSYEHKNATAFSKTHQRTRKENVRKSHSKPKTREVENLQATF